MGDIAGILEELHTHDIRRGAAKDIGRLPKSVFSVNSNEQAKALGHRDASTTAQHYDDQVDDALNIHKPAIIPSRIDKKLKQADESYHKPNAGEVKILINQYLRNNTQEALRTATRPLDFFLSRAPARLRDKDGAAEWGRVRSKIATIVLREHRYDWQQRAGGPSSANTNTIVKSRISYSHVDWKPDLTGFRAKESSPTPSSTALNDDESTLSLSTSAKADNSDLEGDTLVNAKESVTIEQVCSTLMKDIADIAHEAAVPEDDDGGDQIAAQGLSIILSTMAEKMTQLKLDEEVRQYYEMSANEFVEFFARYNVVYSEGQDKHGKKLAARRQGIVLVKNNGILPLTLPTDKNTTISLIGGWANPTTDMQGNYYGVARFLHSPLYAAQQLPNVNVSYGGGLGVPTTDSWDTLLVAAELGDIIIVADGISISDESEGMDRYTIGWQPAAVDIINQFASMGKPVILLQMGDQLDNTPFLNNPNISAILWGGYPGMAGGDALTNVITGKFAPAGRLPVTQYPEDYVNQVPMTNMGLRPHATSGNPGRTYKWFNNAVIPFGYGLHYTNFSVSIAEQGPPSYDISTLISNCNSATHRYLDLCPLSTVNVTVKNTGKLTFDFVTLGFIFGQFGPQPYPVKELVAYERLFNISGGASATTSLELTLGSLARGDESGNAVLYPGDYGLLVDVPTQAMLNFTLTGAQQVLDKWPQRPNKG